MSRKPNNISGGVFGRITAVGDSGSRAGDGSVLWLCLCKCGFTFQAVSRKLKNGLVTSCKSCSNQLLRNYKLGKLKYWSYLRAREHLKKRLQATVEEISIWSYLGHDDGGIDGFDDPYDYKNGEPPRLNFSASEVDAYFLREQIESFKPDDSRRYITLQQLTARWQEPDDSRFRGQEFVRAYVHDDCLHPINVLRGYSEQWVEHTRNFDNGSRAFIPEASLFAMDQVLEIEVSRGHKVAA